MRLTAVLLCVTLAVCPSTARAQGRPREAVVIFKDGFFVKGKVVEKRDFIVDPATGSSFTIPAAGGFLYVDDMVRRIHFSPSQVQDTIEVKKEQLEKQLVFHMNGPTRRGDLILPGWQFETISDWNNKWERTIKVATKTGRFEMLQRIVDITPYFLHGLTVGYDWDFAYLTQEFGPEQTRKLVQQWLAARGELKPYEKRLVLARFLHQCGWYEMADKELAAVAEQFPEQEGIVKGFRAQIRAQQADLLAEDAERLFKVGQHEAAQERLEYLGKDDDAARALADKSRLTVQDLKARYEALTKQVADAKRHLADFPKYTKDRAFWSAACKTVLDELGLDTVGRLETFAGFADQHARELKEGAKPTQKTEEVLALAVTGWLQGNTAAEPDPKAAVKLYRARTFVLSYLRTDASAARADLLAAFTAKNDITPDVLIRLIRLLPPSHPDAEAPEAGVAKKLTIEVPDSDGGKYFVWLPPEYHPQRSYPVVLLLQSHREKAEVLIQRWQREAARHGFILAAPLWGSGLQPTYEYTRGEHSVVLDTLRDLRRRFNVDSDRVFLFGWEQGANAAFDIGLSHPDQFAGVLPMNGAVVGFPQRYASNAQYVPFYVVEGDRNRNHPKNTRGVFKDWIRGHYPSLYIEYKGRGSEWYSAEVANMMDWMSRKRRYHPLKEMGRYHTGGGVGEEFKTMRTGDNRFYWLSTEEVLPKHLNDYRSWSNTIQPATLQASVGVGNETDLKSGAKIWSQFNIRTYGVRQVSLWIAPNQIDFTRPVVVRVNGQQVGGSRTIQPSLATLLEELYASGDRQRLFVARIDIRL